MKLGGAVAAAVIKEAFLEGAAVIRDATPLEEQWLASKAKVHADNALRRGGDTSITARFFTLWREWANIQPTAERGPEECFKRAGQLMREMRELVGDEPFDLPQPELQE